MRPAPLSQGRLQAVRALVPSARPDVGEMTLVSMTLHEMTEE